MSGDTNKQPHVGEICRHVDTYKQIDDPLAPYVYWAIVTDYGDGSPHSLVASGRGVDMDSARACVAAISEVLGLDMLS